MDFHPSTPSSATASTADDYPNDPVSPNMLTDLGLDQSDHLNLLLNNSPHSFDSPVENEKSAGAVDWSLWPPPHDNHYLGDSIKYPDIPMDYHIGFPMTMDYNPCMAVEPSALHFESAFHTPSMFTSNLPISSDLLPSSFPFTFGSDDSSTSSSNTEGRRRTLSITSSSSSSGASFSPVIEAKTPPIPKPENPADELAQRVRQSAGVLLAVPMGLHGQPTQRSTPAQSKLSIPRLPRPKVTTKAKRPTPRSESSSAASSPPASDVHVSSPVLTTQSEHSSTISSPIAPPSSRPKTSHTTIERRYRTNLNARIQSLRQAVPALRVLEEKSRPRKDGEPVDVVDDRGFVDGVKVARKCSKANVLGKAVEYIRVLKRREYRLIREQNGLKSLISGLVGGPALLKEWEMEWRAKFGGGETDELEVEAEPPSDDDEGDDEDGDEPSRDEDEGRAKKKIKIAKPTKKPKKPTPPPAVPGPTVLAPPNQEVLPGDRGVVPEKRKRGRPRKNPTTSHISGPEAVYTTNVLPPETLRHTALAMEQDTQVVHPLQSQSHASQYLLATFALFSFFNSPLTQPTPRSPSHAHTGVVLGHIHVQQPSPLPVEGTFSWRDLLQAFHLIVSALVFCSILATWLPKAIRDNELMSYVLSPISWMMVWKPSPEPLKRSEGKTKTSVRPQLADALDTSHRGTPNEAEQLRSALGVSSGLVGLAQAMLPTKRGKELGFEYKGLVQRAWVRLGELAVLDSTTSIASNFQMYWCMRSHVSWFSASPSDLSTMALLMRRISGSKAAILWNRAKNAQLLRPHEKLVLKLLTVDDATTRLTSRTRDHSEKMDKYSPIGVLASIMIIERTKWHAARLFVHTVVQDQPRDVKEREDFEEEERELIEAAKSLGGRTRELGEMLERVWKLDVRSLEDVDRAFESSEDGGGREENEVEGIKALLKAVLLYRRIFPASIVPQTNGTLLSPPPSPSRKNSKMHLALRRLLGSNVFDEGFVSQTSGDDEGERLGLALDDARDRVVDMLVDLERQLRGYTKMSDAA